MKREAKPKLRVRKGWNTIYGFSPKRADKSDTPCFKVTGYTGSARALKRLAEIAAMDEAGFSNMFPSNWCDPLLTGPSAHLKPGEKLTCQQVEAFVLALKRSVVSQLLGLTAPQPATRKRAKGVRPSCAWVHDDEGTYETACGRSFCFEHELDLGKSHTFCSGCGGKITLPALAPDATKKATGDSA